MGDVEPSESDELEQEVRTANVRVSYVNGSFDLIHVPVVDEYLDEEQAEAGSVYTMEDLGSIIESAFELGAEGVLALPHISPYTLNATVFVQTQNVLTIFAYEDNPDAPPPPQPNA